MSQLRHGELIIDRFFAYDADTPVPAPFCEAGDQVDLTDAAVLPFGLGDSEYVPVRIKNKSEEIEIKCLTNGQTVYFDIDITEKPLMVEEVWDSTKMNPVEIDAVLQDPEGIAGIIYDALPRSAQELIDMAFFAQQQIATRSEIASDLQADA